MLRKSIHLRTWCLHPGSQWRLAIASLIPLIPLAVETSDNESAQVVEPPVGSRVYIFEPYAPKKPAPGRETPIVNDDIDRFQHHDSNGM